MKLGQWVLGAVAGVLSVGAVGAQAAPFHLSPVDAPVAVEMVQFFDDEDDAPGYFDPSPRTYYNPPPRTYYDAPPPRTYYYAPRPQHEPQRRYVRPSPGYTVPTLPDRKGRAGEMVIYDKEEAKDYMKAYRKTQKEIYKEKIRAQNRANGYR